MAEKLPRPEHALARKGQAAGKVMTMAEAVSTFIRPGQAIQFGERGIPLGGPYALQNEIIRRNYGQNPEFTLILYSGNAISLAPLLHTRLAKKVICCFMGDSYPNPSPNPVIQKAYAGGKVEFEEWTMLTLTQRLMAGAMGLPFFPTQSLAGSSLAGQNDNYRLLADPFAGAPVGLVRSLVPDICLVHAWMADEQGNAVIFPPYGGNVYGALAAKEGVILSVERVVSTEELLQYREHVRIPGAYVRAVVEAPFGSHPSGHPSFPLQQGGYKEDKEYILQARRACRSEEGMNAWVNTWILECADHQDYLRKLGNNRLTSLAVESRGAAQPTCAAAASPPLPPTDEEVMIVAAARHIKKTVLEKGFRSVFTGLGAAHLACWLAYDLLQEDGHALNLLVDNGLGGYVPLPGDAYLFARQHIATGSLYSDTLHILGAYVQGAQADCLAVMGAAQIDGCGNINSSKIDSLYLMGAGGGNDAASGAAEIMAVVKQSKQRFPRRVDYVTSPGQRVKTIVTQYGVFEKSENGCFWLTAVHERTGSDVTEIVQLIRSECAWEFGVFATPAVIPLPTDAELKRLRRLDAERLFLGNSK